ncbi:helix-turn-helix domain-containing protein [Pedobacter jamesrossensis]|uniref:Helix-turn-helix domain-containing protein n=1 Tax=Pedobacter jamesrossensis TaxID=1908238 RepID=A0ABV8NJB2_9SPHI
MKHYKSLSGLYRENGFPPPEHPLISLYQCKRTCLLGNREFTGDFYIIGFKKLKSGIIKYGRTRYDHECGSMLFIRPRQVIEMSELELEEAGFLIFFHEDFLVGHPLHEEIKNYHFFEYETNEALHLSPKEEQMVWELYRILENEYHNNPDEFSRELMLANVDSMLKYAKRFYKRQFVNREALAGKMVTRFRDELNLYFSNGSLQTKGLPSVHNIAEMLNISPRYLSDLLKQECGKTALELIHIQLILEAKNRLKRSERQSVAEIAYSLGFENLPYFSRLFKREAGLSPVQFRKLFLN